ncbi:MAG: hypothetical protein ABEJ31_03845 [Haloarculaceae archaeon]
MDTDPARTTDEHLGEIEDGCGCTEIWEHLSERRVANDPDPEPSDVAD